MAQTFQTKPILESSWETNTLDTGAVIDELTRLWAQLGGPEHGGEAPGEMVAESHAGGGGLMRANTLNLIAVAENQENARLITETVAHLKNFLPSRTVVFITDEDPNRTKTWNVLVQLNEAWHSSSSAPALRFETIIISADPKVAGHLASLVSPLLMTELPTFLWWPSGDFASSPIFRDLVEIVDRLIVDSAQLGNDAETVAQLRTLLDDEDDPWVGDFTWSRLQPWCNLIAQFFDPNEVRDALNNISQVNIAYAETRKDSSSGFAAALLMVGWLGSRLGWEVLEPLERRKAGGWSAPLRVTTPSGKRRDVQIRLTTDQSPEARFSLRSVELIARGEQDGTFRVIRTDKDDLITSSESSDAPYVSRMVYARRYSTVEMLGEQLQRFGPDRIFEDAIRFATRLLP
ncbi:MAG TPA: glucose-6-phosphate dehydrogenase assembly protein OpcA [Thermomicrobiales bacterium]|nr:glucose-6-phosphate dehydrogenase assembly protein OpcA [Thermomicrobiales bacterium]